MRTTLDIDEDLLQIARQLALERGETMGQVISALVKKALAPKSRSGVRNGIELLTPVPGGKRPHVGLVNRLTDDE